MKAEVSINDEKILNGVVIPLKKAHKFSDLINKLLFCYVYNKEFRMKVNNIDVKSLEQIRYFRKNRRLLDLQSIYSRSGFDTLESVNNAIKDMPLVMSDIVGTAEGREYLIDELERNIKPIYKDKLADRLYLRYKYLKTLQEAVIFSGANERRYKCYCNQVNQSGVVPLDAFVKIQLGIEDNKEYIKRYDESVLAFFEDYIVEGFDTESSIVSDLQQFIYSRLINIGIYIPSADEIVLKDFFTESGQFSVKNFLDIPLEVDVLDEEYNFCQSVVK